MLLFEVFNLLKTNYLAAKSCANFSIFPTTLSGANKDYKTDRQGALKISTET